MDTNDKIYESVKKQLEILYPGHKQYLNDLTAGYLSVKIANNPHSLYSLRQLKDLESDYPDNTRQKWFYYVTLLNSCRSMERYDDENLYREKAYGIITNIGKNVSIVGQPAAVGLLAQSKLEKSLSFFWQSDTTTFREGFGQLLEEIDTISDPVMQGRLLRSLYCSFPAKEILDRQLNKELLVKCVESALTDPCREAGAIAFCRSELQSIEIYNPEKTEYIVNESISMLKGSPLEKMFEAEMQTLLGDSYCYTAIGNRMSDAEEAYKKAISYFTDEEDYNRMCMIYYTLSDGYKRSGNQEKAAEYAREYWKVRPKSFGTQYKTDTDFLTQMTLIEAIPDPQKRIDALFRLKTLSEENGMDLIAGMLWGKIANAYYHDFKDGEKARKAYEQAFPIMVEGYFMTRDLSFFVDFLSFLIYTNEMSRHNEVAAALIDILESVGDNYSLGYCQLLAYESQRAIDNNNPVAMMYYMAKLMSLSDYIMGLATSDYDKAKSASVFVPVFVNFFAYVKNNSSKEIFDLYGSWDVEKLLNATISLYSQFSKSDYGYTRLLFAKENYLMASERYEEAADVLDEIETNPFFSGFESRDFIAPTQRINLYLCTGNYSEAEKLLNLPRFKDLIASSSSSTNINLITYLFHNLFKVYVENKNYVRARDAEKQRFDLTRSFVANQFSSLDEGTRIGLSASGVLSANNINSLLSIDPTPDNASLAYDAALFYRNLLLESSDMQRRAIMNSGDSTLIADYRNLLMQRKQLSELNSSTDPGKQREWSNLIARSRELEADIASRCEGFRNMEMKRTADWHKIERRLRGNDAAIEFISLFNPQDSVWRYGALVLRHGYKTPQYVGLLSHSDLDEALKPVTTASKQEKGVNRAYSYNSNGKKLYDGLWLPLLPYLDGVTDVYMATEGRLSTVAFPAIEDSTRTSLCERYNLHMMSTTANVLDKKSKSKSDKIRMAIIGGVNYDADPEKAESRTGEWICLPQSRSEIDYVESICSSLPKVTAMRLDGDAASEKAIRDFSGDSPEVMLMSTHGFYIPADLASRKDFFLNKGITSDSVPNLNIPSMQRGGLVLADGNKVWNNEGNVPDDEDGILTGWEISGLDLSNTRLAVLSACETGLGEVSDSEGIDGLQRGMKLAGVGTLVVSLWRVNDSAGMQFMQSFHDRMLRDGEECHEAFRNTQREMKQKYPRNPFMWAPFIMLD